MLKMFLMRLRKRSRKLHKSGEISIYLSLVFMLMISLLLTVIEAARGTALQVLYECSVESALLSTFGEYNRELLDKYDVFFIDLSYMSNSPDPKNLQIRLNEYFNDNFFPQEDASLLFYSDFLDVTETNVSLTEYELATDNFGEPFVDQVVEYMSNLVGTDFVTEMENTMVVWDSYNLDTETFDTIKDSAISQVTYSEEDEWEQTVIKDGLLSLINENISIDNILPDSKVSHQTISETDTLLFRSKHKGNWSESTFDMNPIENIYFNEYVLMKTGNYLEPRSDTYLKYETEYIIVGGPSDYQNARRYAEMLLAARALENFISLNLASDKVEEVRGVAEFIAPIIRLPEPVVTQIILVGWSLIEAVVDVKDLLKGEKVPLIKRSEEIKVSFGGILESIGGEIADGDSDSMPLDTDGIPDLSLGYNDYLRIFLYLVPSPVKTYRTMDIIELNLRNSGNGNDFFRFDSCADKVKAVFTIESGFDFRYTGEKKYSYF